MVHQLAFMVPYLLSHTIFLLLFPKVSILLFEEAKTRHKKRYYSQCAATISGPNHGCCIVFSLIKRAQYRVQMEVFDLRIRQMWRNIQCDLSVYDPTNKHTTLTLTLTLTPTGSVVFSVHQLASICFDNVGENNTQKKLHTHTQTHRCWLLNLSDDRSPGNHCIQQRNSPSTSKTTALHVLHFCFCRN